MRGLTEIEAAARAGFTRWDHFRRARNRGLFPPPVHDLPGAGPIWSEEQIERWLNNRNRRKSEREEALARIGDAEEAV